MKYRAVSLSLKRTMALVPVLALLLAAAALPSAQAADDNTARYDEYEISYYLLRNMKADQKSIVFVPDKNVDTDLIFLLVQSVYPHEFSLGLASTEQKIEYPSDEMTKDAISMYPLEKLEWHTKAQDKARSIVASVVTPAMSDRQKAQALHDWLVRNCRYDYSVSSSEVLPYTAYAALVHGAAVCNGYTYAYSMLLDLAGIPAMRVTGQATQSGKLVHHAWNMVLIDGQWKYVDVTWDDLDNGTVSNAYFLLTAEQLRKNHSWDETPYLKFVPYVLPDRPDYARALAARGLFRGTSENNFDLSESPNRAQGAVMMARLFRYDESAPYTRTHPFSDVPGWADAHVNFLHGRGFINGTSAHMFSSLKNINVNEYLTLLLRVMGYQEGVDFTWDKASDMGQRLALVDNALLSVLKVRPFLRADMVNITYKALETLCPDGATLSMHLAAETPRGQQ